MPIQKYVSPQHRLLWWYELEKVIDHKGWVQKQT